MGLIFLFSILIGIIILVIVLCIRYEYFRDGGRRRDGGAGRHGGGGGHSRGVGRYGRPRWYSGGTPYRDWGWGWNYGWNWYPWDWRYVEPSCMYWGCPNNLNCIVNYDSVGGYIGSYCAA